MFSMLCLTMGGSALRITNVVREFVKVEYAMVKVLGIIVPVILIAILCCFARKIVPGPLQQNAKNGGLQVNHAQVTMNAHLVIFAGIRIK